MKSSVVREPMQAAYLADVKALARQDVHHLVRPVHLVWQPAEGSQHPAEAKAEWSLRTRHTRKHNDAFIPQWMFADLDHAHRTAHLIHDARKTEQRTQGEGVAGHAASTRA